jgi:YVTN family beta-propeller protein
MFVVCGELLSALSTGPTIPRTGAPGESKCTGCHHSADDNVRGTMALSFSGGSTYTPGVWKQVTITITPNPTTAAPVKYGFQASSRAADGSRAGTFGIINDGSQFMALKCAASPTSPLTDRPAGGSCGAAEQEYIQHNQSYTGFGGSAFTVSFLWQPPASNVGAVTFYATSVLAISPYATPTDAFRTSTTLSYQAPATSVDPVYPAGSLGLEALDTPSNQIIATRTVTTFPLYKTAMKRNGSRLYGLTLRGDELLTIDPRSGAVLNTGSVAATALALSPDESRLYVVGQLTSDAARLYIFNPFTGADAGHFDFASSSYYYQVAPSPDGKRIYILPLNNGPVLVVDAASLSPLTSITMTSRPNALAVSPDSSRLYVTTSDDSLLTVFSTATNTIATQVPLDPSPRGVVFSPSGSRAYVLTQDVTNFVRITTFDVASSSPIAQFWFPSLGFSYFFRISRDGMHLYGGGNANPGGEPNVTAWSVSVGGVPLAIPSAQGVLDIGVPPPAPIRPPFTDLTLTSGVTMIKAVHITELRARIDAASIAMGLGGFPWTDPVLAPGSAVIKAIHINELRTALASVYVAAGLIAPSYTDNDLTAGTVVKAAHVLELRASVEAIE